MLQQQAPPPPNEWLQWASVIVPLLLILFNNFAPKFAQWRRNRADDQKAEREAEQARRRVDDMQSAGWEKLYLIQEDMINRLTQENAELKIQNGKLREK